MVAFNQDQKPDSKPGLTNVSSEYIFYPRSGVDSNGKIHLEMLNLIVIVDPEKVPESSPPAPSANINRVVSAEDVFFDNPFFSPVQYRGLDNAFPAGSGQTLSFDYSAANLSPSNKIRYSHRLKGYSDRWSSPQLYNHRHFQQGPTGALSV